MAAKGRGTVLPLPDGIAAAWALPPGAVAEPLGGGHHNTLLRVDDVVVRIEERAAESVAWEHELLAWLAPEVPRLHRRGRDWPNARPRAGRPAYAELDWERNDWWDWTAIAEKPPELVRAFEHARARGASNRDWIVYLLARLRELP